jgi:hypothetical protein
MIFLLSVNGALQPFQDAIQFPQLQEAARGQPPLLPRWSKLLRPLEINASPAGEPTLWIAKK